jgi:hypothetical protein
MIVSLEERRHSRAFRFAGGTAPFFRSAFIAKKEEYSDAIMLLKADHRTVEELFKKFEAAKNDDKKLQLAQEICTELKIHAMIEDEIFYPTFRGTIEDGILDEAYVERDGAKVLINDIIANGADDQFFEAKVTVLGEEIKHHVKEEEQGKDGMFAQCRETDVDLKELRDRLIERKQELIELAKSQGMPPALLGAVNLGSHGKRLSLLPELRPRRRLIGHPAALIMPGQVGIRGGVAPRYRRARVASAT